MGRSSGRVATAALLLVGLGVLAVAGRLLPSASSPEHPAITVPVIRTAPGNTRGYAVPDVLGRTLAQAEQLVRIGGLHGAVHDRDPKGGDAVVVAQEPPTGVLVPPGSVVGFRTRTGVQPAGLPRRLRLGPGRTTVAYRIVAPDPATHQLMVVVVVPRATDLQVWLEAESGSGLPVLASTGDGRWCRPSGGKLRCVVRVGVPAPGVWTARVTKRSSGRAAIEITVAFTPL